MPLPGVIRVTTPDGQVKEYEIDFDSAIVGRADGNRIVIPHVSVSRRHAHLTVENGQLMAEDFSSATGTFINGRALQPGEKLPIPPGTDVRFGEAQAIWVAPAAAPPPPPAEEEAPEPVAIDSDAPVRPPEPEPEPEAEPEQVEYTPPPAAVVPSPPVAAPVMTPPPPPPPVRPEPPRPAAPDTSSAAAAMAAQGEAVQRQYVGVNLQSPPAAVMPGQAAAATVVLQNRGPIVDEFTVTIADIPADWVQIARPRIQLLPGARDELTVVIRPPEGPRGTAGAHRFTIVVTSREHTIDVRAIGEVTVTPVEKIEAIMRPTKGKGSYTIEVTNRGNTTVPLVIEGSDNEGMLDFDTPNDETIAPGETRSIKVGVAPHKKKKFGRQSSTAFRFNVRSASSGAPPIRLDGTNSYQPPLERWKVPFAALLIFAGLGSGGYGVVNLCSRNTGICADLLNKTKDSAATKDETPAPATPGATEATTEATSGATTATEAECPSVRLKPGQNAVIINSESSKTFVRAQPSRDAAVIGQVGSGFQVTTIRCQKAQNGEDLIFWEVTLSSAINGETSGWIAEQDPGSKQFLLSPA